MQTVPVGSVDVDVAIEHILKPENLKHLANGHKALCFALVREMAAKKFYSHLIGESSTIDPTTGKYIDFVFFLNKSGITVPDPDDPASTSLKYEVQGFSVSTPFQGPSDLGENAQDIRDIEVGYDQELADKVRNSPSEVDGAKLSQQMGRAMQYLMHQYSVPEAALPCLLFVDGCDPLQSITVQLGSKHPLTSCYEDALRPIAGEFQELLRFRKKREEIGEIRRKIEDSTIKTRELPKKISESDDELNKLAEEVPIEVQRYSSELDQWRTIQEVIGGSYENPSVCTKIEHLPVASKVIAKLEAYQRQLTEAKNIEAHLSRLASQETALSPAQLSLKRTRLENRLGRLRESIDDRAADIPAFVTANIQRLEQSIIEAQKRLSQAQADKRKLEKSLEDAETYLRTHTLDTLAEKEKSLAAQERELRSRGHDDDVLVDPDLRAFSVIEVLDRRKRLGASEVNPLKDTSGKSAWANGLFYLCTFVVVIAALGFLAGSLPFYTLALIIIAGILFVPLIGALQLKMSGEITDESFMELIKLVIAQLPLISGFAKREPPSQ